MSQNQKLSQTEIDQRLLNWGEGLKQVHNLESAQNFVEKFYNFEEEALDRRTLFKPTVQGIVTTLEDASNYFYTLTKAGQVSVVWRKINQRVIYRELKVAATLFMGTYDFIQNNKFARAEFSFVFNKNMPEGHGNKIILHHSSLPFVPLWKSID